MASLISFPRYRFRSWLPGPCPDAVPSSVGRRVGVKPAEPVTPRTDPSQPPAARYQASVRPRDCKLCRQVIGRLLGSGDDLMAISRHAAAAASPRRPACLHSCGRRAARRRITGTLRRQAYRRRFPISTSAALAPAAIAASGRNCSSILPLKRPVLARRLASASIWRDRCAIKICAGWPPHLPGLIEISPGELERSPASYSLRTWAGFSASGNPRAIQMRGNGERMAASN